MYVGYVYGKNQDALKCNMTITTKKHKIQIIKFYGNFSTCNALSPHVELKKKKNTAL